MNRYLAIALLALPMGAFFSITKPASAAVPFSPALSQGTIVAQRYDDRYDGDHRDEYRNERSWRTTWPKHRSRLDRHAQSKIDLAVGCEQRQYHLA